MTANSAPAGMAKRTYLRNALNKGEAGVGMWLTLPGSALAKTVATIPGFNWILIDAEHGQIVDSHYYDVGENTLIDRVRVLMPRYSFASTSLLSRSAPSSASPATSLG